VPNNNNNIVTLAYISTHIKMEICLCSGTDDFAVSRRNLIIIIIIIMSLIKPKFAKAANALMSCVSVKQIAFSLFLKVLRNMSVDSRIKLKKLKEVHKRKLRVFKMLKYPYGLGLRTMIQNKE